MSYLIKNGNTTRNLLFMLVQSSDHITGLTGATPTVTISKNGGAFATPAGAVTEVANGLYKVAANATDASTNGPLFLHATAASGDPVDVQFEVVNFDPDDSQRLGLAVLPSSGTLAVKPAVTLAPADVSGNLPANAVQIGGAAPGSATIGTVGTVTNAVTAATVTDKSGYTLSGAGVSAVQSGLATSANQTTINNNVLGVNTIVTAIQTVLSGITSLAQWLGALAGKQTANSTALAEIRATGAGSGTFDATLDSLEAIRNRGDAAWVTGGGSGSDPLTNASTGYAAGEIGYEIHWLYQRGNADEVIDTTSSPGWNIVYYVQGTTSELLRQRLLDISGNPVKLATTIVAQTKK